MWYSDPITTTTATTTTWNWEPQITWTTSSNWDKYKRAEFLQDWIKRQEKRENFAESEIKEYEVLNLIKGDN